jgi:catechol 2,3-dioxygenase-like lactoylglutathione lyase family enzyme
VPAIWPGGIVSLETELQATCEAGPATGRINRMNHIQIIVSDMAQSIKFYQDILGLRVISTIGTRLSGDLLVQKVPGAGVVGRNYFLEMSSGELISLIEVPSASRPNQSVFVPSFWPGEAIAPSAPNKIDHLAFNVESKADLLWFQRYLREHGVVVSDVVDRDEQTYLFVTSIYFYDPSGNPLEIATFDWADPKWENHDRGDWFLDKDPVPTLGIE